MHRYLREDLNSLLPYQANEFNYRIKMDANENPFDIPDSVRKQLASEVLKGFHFNLYPDSDSNALREALSQMYGISHEEILVGNGSDELIHLIISAFVNKGEYILCPTPSFSMYKIFTQVAGGKVVEVPLKDDFSYDMESFRQMSLIYNPRIVFLCSPNNPTGNVIPRTEILNFAEWFQGIVVVDEAYSEFSMESIADDAARYSNIVVLRTFSKAMGLAGLRVGYSISNWDLAQQIYKVKPPYNLNSFSQRAACLLLENLPEVQERINYIIEQRELMVGELRNIKSVMVYPSQANFILIKSPEREQIYKKLLDNGILVRDYEGSSVLKDCLRITVSDEKQNADFLKVFTQAVKEGAASGKTTGNL